MYVELPAAGCNIVNSATTIYNYSPDSHTRTTYVLIDGKLYKQSESYSQMGYTYSGTCLSTGDLQYRPEIKIYFEAISFALCFIIGWLLFRLIIRRLRWRGA